MLSPVCLYRGMVPSPETGGSDTSSYRPYTNTRRPGGKPDYEPAYRVLVHRRHQQRWEELADRIGLDQAQRFYDHVAQHPGEPAEGVRMNVLRGRAGDPGETGFSRTVHWRVPGRAARLDYQYHPHYSGGSAGDKHAVVRVIAIVLSSH
jgi:hypothetical protein